MAARRQEEVAEVQSRAELPEGMEGIVDRDTLNTEEYHYRFVQDRPQNMARKRSKGYVPVIAEEEGVKTLTEEVSADGMIRDGDSILMRVPLDRFKKRRKQLADFTESRLTAPVQNFMKKAKGSGPGGQDVRVDTSDKDKLGD